MTFVSKLALAAALTLGTSLSVAPAMAQKADKNAPQLKVSDEFRKPAAAADAAFKAKDYATADTQLAAAEAVAKNDDEKYYAASLRLQLELARNSEQGQMKALQVLIVNPKTPADRQAVYNQVYNYMVGSQLMNQGKAAQALPLLLKARELGNTSPDLPVLLANAYAGTGKNAEAVAEVDRAIQSSKAAGKKPPEDWYRFAIPRVNQTGDRAAMASWLTRYMQDYPTTKNWRWAIQVFRQGTPAGGNEKVERIDLYRLMRATNVLADRGDYANYAISVQQAGLPWEAVSVIDEGRKVGKLPATDADTASLYTASKAAVRSEGSLDALAKQGQSASSGTAAAHTGDALLAAGDYARALAVYDVAISKGGANADEVNMHRGIALRALGRKDEAKAAFAQVGKTGPYGNLAFLWSASVDFPPLAG
jgi:tetratricopeptide (TPR) repeat protein